MTAAVSHSPEPYEVPDGGLASFLTATVGDWSDEALNADNYYDIVKPTADQLAAFGREEDDRIAHVATGETVIPMAVFEEDPALKEALFSRMREMGIEPERYVVGNELNSINPVTGQPEFFLKKIFKGIKKAVKGVVKVFKKLAPVILSVGLNFMFPGLGTIAAGALGSGIGTLVQGGSLKDAFKSALIGGAVGGLASGIGSVAQGGEFMAGVKSGLPTGLGGGVNPTLPGPDISKITSVEPTEILDTATGGPQVMDPVTAGTPVTAADAVGAATKSPTDFMIEQNIARRRALESAVQGSGGSAPTMSVADKAAQLAKGPTSAQLAQLDAPTLTGASSLTDPTSQLIRNKQMQDAIIAGQPAPDVTAQTLQELADQGIGTAPSAGGSAGGLDYVDAAGNITAAGENFVTSNLNTKGFFESMRDFIRNPSFDSLKQAFVPDKLTAKKIQELIRTSGAPNAQQFTLQAGENLASALTKAGINPGIMRSYAPMLITGALVAEPLGFFDPPEMEELDEGIFALNSDEIRRNNPDLFGQMFFNTRPAFAGQAPTGRAAAGGDISNFPRKNGAIYGPGTETSDDIPAMLSDGEFVMTAKAVRGAGNGSREAGMRRMYDMMRNFERGAARGN